MIINLKCKKCGYEWRSRIKLPKECPHCKNRNWNKGKEEPKEEPKKLNNLKKDIWGLE